MKNSVTLFPTSSQLMEEKKPHPFLKKYDIYLDFLRLSVDFFKVDVNTFLYFSNPMFKVIFLKLELFAFSQVCD